MRRSVTIGEVVLPAVLLLLLTACGATTGSAEPEVTEPLDATATAAADSEPSEPSDPATADVTAWCEHAVENRHLVESEGWLDDAGAATEVVAHLVKFRDDAPVAVAADVAALANGLVPAVEAQDWAVAAVPDDVFRAIDAIDDFLADNCGWPLIEVVPDDEFFARARLLLYSRVIAAGDDRAKLFWKVEPGVRYAVLDEIPVGSRDGRPGDGPPHFIEGMFAELTVDQ